MKSFAIIILVLLSGLPVIAGLGGSVANGSDWAGWRTVLTTPGIAQSVTLALWTGITATALSLVIAHLTVMVAATGQWSIRLRSIVLPLIALPHLAMAIGIALVLSPSGLILRLLSPWMTGLTVPPDWQTVQDPAGVSLILGLIVKEAPFLVLALGGALSQVPSERMLTQARILGYGRLKGWLVGVAPLLQRQIGLPIAAVLVFSLANVEMAIPLGPQMPPTLGNLVWQWFSAGDLAQRDAAAAGALLLLATSLAALGLWRIGSRLAGTFAARFTRSGYRRRNDVAWRRLAAIPWFGITTLGAVSIVALVLRALNGMWRFPAVLPQHAIYSQWTTAAPGLGAAFATTLEVAALTALVVTALTLAGVEALHDDEGARIRMTYLLFLPLLIPQLAFLFGWQVVLVRLRWDGTLFAVIWSHTVLALPYAWGVLAGARTALDRRLPKAARLLGASPLRAWITVTLPLMLRPTLLAAALAFSVSAAVYLPTQFAGAGRIATVATEAAAAASSGNLRMAASYGAAQMAAPLLALGAAIGISALLFANRRGMPS